MSPTAAAAFCRLTVPTSRWYSIWMIGFVRHDESASSSRALLLVIENPTFRERLAAALERRGLLVVRAASAAHGLTRASALDIWGAVIDLPESSALIPLLLDRSPALSLLVLHGFVSHTRPSSAPVAGNVRRRCKPLDADDVLSALLHDGGCDTVPLPVFSQGSRAAS